MKRIVPLSLSLVALASLAACGGVERTTALATPAPMATAAAPTVNYQRTGAVGMASQSRGVFGHVDSIVSVLNPDGTLSGRHRLGLRMQDGSARSVDTRDANMQIQIGDLVGLTRDGQIVQ